MPRGTDATGLLDPYGHDQEGDSQLVEAALHGEGGVVEEHAGEEAVLHEDDLAAEEYGAGVFLVDFPRQAADLVRNIGADGREALGEHALRLQETHVAVQPLLDVGAQ